MSTTAPWLALACDWHDSPMLAGTTGGQKLAWIAILCFSKSLGRAGVFTLRREKLCKEFCIEPSDLEETLRRAAQDGAITIDGETVTLVNWRVYQDPSKRHGSLVKAPPFSKKSATKDPSPLTKHTSHVTKSKSARAPMQIPSPADCIAYGQTIELPKTECAKFHDYQCSKGWLVGKAPM